MNATATVTTETTTEARFNSAVEALRADGITVVLNHKGAMEYKPYDKIAWNSYMPTIVFNREGEPVIGRNDEFMDVYAGEPVKKMVMLYVGQNTEVQDAITEHFSAAGFLVSGSGSFYTGMTIWF